MYRNCHMEGAKSCIFHVPNYINSNVKSGSQIRPIKMLEAFKEIGYQVDIVMGYGRERREQIKKIKEKILSGQEYDFLYSESSTMPTLLTEKNHIPFYPLLDFGFFRFCKMRGIRIGVFYRDIYWKFEEYRQEVPKCKQMISIPMYKYDLRKYRRLTDVLYLPSLRMKEQIIEYNIPNIKALPPGAIKNMKIIAERKRYYETRKDGNLKLFYVGGVKGLYDLTFFLKAIYNEKYVYLTICCKKDEWELEEGRYEPYLTERVDIVHLSGDDLAECYMKADICCCCFEASKYRSFAMPIKLLEYIGYLTPIIATKGTEAGNFVERFQCGFCVDYNEADIVRVLKNIYHQQKVLLEKHRKTLECLEENTWIQRAYQVKGDLKGDLK